ncbi:Hypothetical_protein [Hexamita inflata]|uniref:Hypothetical_protein n=1 Tax=Hexamita inflata TaxID=28002 RepID=A0AA86Q815_9EUKA|nr:Hypothetical protein HINF_LOCUS38769 [Hexamita inflata]CAI9951127.1 Hypothetical protein HINF_LOCUS38772 [Hexamita inflata]
MTYTDYSSCYKNCFEGICELGYNSFTKHDEYTCSPVSADSVSFWWFMIIPGVLLVILMLSCCCCYEREENSQVQHVDTEAVLAPTQNKSVSKPAKVGQNVTGVASQGQRVTLPNGQVGIFIALTLPQQDQVRQLQAIQQAPQFYQPQPIFQQTSGKGQQVYGQTVEMPQMPNLM